MRLRLHLKPHPHLPSISAPSCFPHFLTDFSRKTLCHDLLTNPHVWWGWSLEAEPKTKHIHRKARYIGTAMALLSCQGPFSNLDSYHKMFLLAKRADQSILLNSALYKKEYSWTEWAFFLLFLARTLVTKPRKQTKENQDQQGRRQAFCQAHKGSEQLHKTPLREVSSECVQM